MPSRDVIQEAGCLGRKINTVTCVRGVNEEKKKSENRSTQRGAHKGATQRSARNNNKKKKKKKKKKRDNGQKLCMCWLRPLS